jgi:hypothetical protein
MDVRKLSFQEVWESSNVFYVDENLENEFENKVDDLLESANEIYSFIDNRKDQGLLRFEEFSNILIENQKALDIILMEINLSGEKFKRIISLLRKMGIIAGGFEREWEINQIKSKMSQDTTIAQKIASLLLNGKNNIDLSPYIPKYYLDTLNYQEIGRSTAAARRNLYKSSLSGSYGGRKGYYVEGKIQIELERIRNKYGIGFQKGKSRIIHTNIDFAIPNLDDPWIVIMSSFQETTSSGQTNKAKDMAQVYSDITRMNDRNQENRIFINFVDGGGWLARKTDLERLVKQCDYFINFHYLSMLESIILKHIPRTYINNH